MIICRFLSVDLLNKSKRTCKSWSDLSRSGTSTCVPVVLWTLQLHPVCGITIGNVLKVGWEFLRGSLSSAFSPWSHTELTVRVSFDSNWFWEPLHEADHHFVAVPAKNSRSARQMRSRLDLDVKTLFSHLREKWTQSDGSTDMGCGIYFLFFSITLCSTLFPSYFHL